MFSTRLLTLFCSSFAIASAESFTGDGTTYTLGAVSDGNCNFMSAIGIASTNYAALNNDQWDDLANCGRCAQVSCIDSRCSDPTATAIVQIVDRCPECKTGDLDLSPTVFKTITGSDPSRLKIKWEFVDCPNPETVKICLKTGSNGYWTAVQPTNTVIGVKSVSINDQPTSMLDGAYYYLVTSSIGLDLSNVKVSVTSVTSEVIEGTYSLTADQCTDTYRQFTSTNSAAAMPSTVPTTTIPATDAPLGTTAPAILSSVTTTEAPATVATPAKVATPAAKCSIRRHRQ